jgi:hypothetical protein
VGRQKRVDRKPIVLAVVGWSDVFGLAFVGLGSLALL